jgi:molybdate transport system substrate-binding protein
MTLTILQRPFFRLLLVVMAPWVLASPARSEEITVAVAANFTGAMAQLATAFEADSGHQVKVSYGSSGRLYAQIINGAPFDVFLSADQEKATALVDAGKAEADSRITYAVGRLILWSPDDSIGDISQHWLATVSIKRLALANPRVAPYGAAAMDVLDNLGLASQYQDRLVMGENISQTYQFVSTGNAQAGFVALSQVFRGGGVQVGTGWIVPESLHAPIRQDAVITHGGMTNPAAKAFVNFLRQDEAKSIIKSFGYGTD